MSEPQHTLPPSIDWPRLVVKRLIMFCFHTEMFIFVGLPFYVFGLAVLICIGVKMWLEKEPIEQENWLFLLYPFTGWINGVFVQTWEDFKRDATET